MPRSRNTAADEGDSRANRPLAAFVCAPGFLSRIAIGVD